MRKVLTINNTNRNFVIINILGKSGGLPAYHTNTDFGLNIF